GADRRGTRRTCPRYKPGNLPASSRICGAARDFAGRYKIRIWIAGGSAPVDRRSAYAGFFALLARRGAQTRRSATFLRQTVCSRLFGTHSMAEKPARPGTAFRCCRRNSSEVPGSVSHPGGTRVGLSSTGPNRGIFFLERADVKDQLEGLVTQMVERGILFDEAVEEFEKRFIKRVLDRAEGNQSRAAHILGIHRNTLSRKIGEYKLDHRRNHSR